jgi:hypothetical protein
MKSSSKDGNQPQQKSGQKQQAQDSGAPGSQQQQSGEGQANESKEYGEGNYKATRQYNEGLKEHVQHHDIEKEARDAAPKSADEEREMEEAERIARSRARGTESPDAPEDENDLTR